jgi:inosine-uridine nucleoside N-ribohydrolase
MTHKRNTQGLINNAQKKRRDTIKKAEKTIEALLRAKKNVNFVSVSKAANVSKAWLYKENSIADRIFHIRNQQKTVNAIAPKSSQQASDSSKDAIIKTLKERIKKVEKENCELKKQLEVTYGQIHFLTKHASV